MKKQDEQKDKAPCPSTRCKEVCPECGKPCVSERHEEWKHRCPDGHTWWMKYCYSL